MNARPRHLPPDPPPVPEREEEFVPTTELAKELWAIRQEYIAAGGKLYSMEEILAELAEWNGEASDDDSTC